MQKHKIADAVLGTTKEVVENTVSEVFFFSYSARAHDKIMYKDSWSFETVVQIYGNDGYK